MQGLLLRNLRLADGGPEGRRLLIREGRIAAILAPDAPDPACPAMDLGGELLLPGLVEGHTHLDKSLFGLPWIPHRAEPNRMSRIENDERMLPGLPLDTTGRAGALLRQCVAHGTAHIRTHADITPAFGLSALEGTLEAAQAHAHAASVQVVAFPQAGVMRAGGKKVLDLLDAAIGAGAEVVGGIDPCEVDRDPKGQLDGIFAIAEKRGVGVDIHLHEPGEMGLFSLQEICARTQALGMGGTVVVSHGFCLGGISESKQKAAVAMMAEAGVALATHGAGSATIPPIMQLRNAGVRVHFGNDNTRDSWGPYGNADMLERAAIIGWRSDMRHDALLAEAFAMASSADWLGIDNTIAEGNPANFFTIAAENVQDAVGRHPKRGVVFFQGRVVARGGEWVG